MPHATRAGDVLADRYRLVDLLSESGGGRFWRAHDRILERHVALHVIAADDPRAELLLDAARRSATVLDQRILRVLDAERIGESASWSTSGAPAPRSTSCWPATGRCRRDAVPGWSARWPTRSPPRTRTASPTGCSRPRTCCSTAPARSGSSASASTQRCTACRRATRSATSSTWPGCCTPRYRALGGRLAVRRTPSAREARPGPATAAGARRRTPRLGRPLRRPAQPARPEGARPPRPRQRAGHPELPGGVRRRPDRPGPAIAAGNPEKNETVVLPAVPEILARPHPDDWVAPAEPHPDPDPEPDPEPEPDSGRRGPTQAGLPIFDDENDEVSWLRARDEPAPPPPPFEEPPERPLFAEDARKPRYARPDAGPVVARGDEYWPFDNVRSSGSGQSRCRRADRHPRAGAGRNWLRLAMLVAVILVLLVAVAIAVNLGRGKTPLGAEPDNDEPTTSTCRASPPRGGAHAVPRPGGERPRPAGRRRGELRGGRRSRRRRPRDLVDHADLQAAARPQRPQARRRPRRRPRPVPRRTPGRPHARGRAHRPGPLPERHRAHQPGGADTVAEAGRSGHASFDLDDAATGRYLTIWFTSLPVSTAATRVGSLTSWWPG